MNAEEFLQHLEFAMPVRSTLESYGLDDEEIGQIQSAFVASRSGASDDPQLSEVERMVADFDCSSLEVGLLRFHGGLTDLPQGSCFGVLEADPLVVARDGSVRLVDHSRPDANSQGCAANGRAFLDGLATFLSLRGEKAAWKGRVNEAALRCAESAGGEAYVAFFRSLCAFLEA